MKKKNLTKALTTTAVFAALSTAIMFLEIQIPIFPGFLKMDFSEIPALLMSFMFGPVYGIAVVLIKNAVHIFSTQTGGVGEVANFIVGAAFVAPGGIIYKYKRNFKGALLGMIAGTISICVVGFLSNYFILIPAFVNIAGYPFEAIIGMASKIIPAVDNKFKLVLYSITPFNLMKGVIVSIITLLLYKRLHKIINRVFESISEINLDKVFKERGEQTFTTRSEEGTRKIAAALMRKLCAGTTVALSGELGAGKTVFAKGAATALGISEEVTSPTFTLLKVLKGERCDLYHIDAWRLTGAEEGEAAGLKDYIGNTDGITLIEWPENIRGLVGGAVSVTITNLGKNKRRLVIKNELSDA